LSKPLDPELIDAIAAELGVHPSFVEKDWHGMRLVAAIAGTAHEELQPVFSGGTSLSKGYDLIKRLSEDLDFKMDPGELSQKDAVKAFKDWRRGLVETIRNTGEWTLEDDDIEVMKGSAFVRCRIGYTSTIPQSKAFRPTERPEVKLEISLSAPAMDPQDRPLQSWVSLANRQAPEVTAMPCISPVETAADKLSALTWRVLNRDRASTNDDKAMIRHLHDLAALKALATAHPEFPILVAELLESDSKRGKLPPEFASLKGKARLDKALDIIKADKEYREEYDRFVLGMSYAAEGEAPTFDEALTMTRQLINISSAGRGARKPQPY
jgi:hypothetical protein